MRASSVRCFTRKWQGRTAKGTGPREPHLKRLTVKTFFRQSPTNFYKIRFQVFNIISTDEREGFTMSKTHCFRLFFCHHAWRPSQPPDWLSAPRSFVDPVRRQCVSSFVGVCVLGIQCVDRSDAVRGDARQQCETQCAW
jgi:hypothetical protein